MISASDLDGCFETLLRPDPVEALEEVEDLAGWLDQGALSAPPPFIAALLGGARADRLAWAFGSGYRAALRALAGSRATRLTALCVTEAGGGHPRAMTTEVTEGVLQGEKTYVTFGPAAEVLWVLAKEGEDDGRPRLGLYAVEASRAGVTVEAGAHAFPFVPELPHGRARFEDVAVSPEDRFRGDGFAAYVRPFRTVEDVHVHLALLGWLVAHGRRWAAFGEAALEEALGLLVAFRALSVAPPSAASTHLALAGAIAGAARLVEGLDWSAAPDVDRERWKRDRALLRVASKARTKRREKAWAALVT